MSDFQVQVQRLVDELVARITAIAHKAATDTLAAAIGAAEAAIAQQRALAGARPPAPAAHAPGSNGVRGKGEKRASDEIERTKLRVLDFVRRNPGLRVEQINRELGTTTRELVLPLRKLIAEGQLRSEGEKRSTQYFPAGELPRAPAAPAAAPAPLRRRKT